MKKITVLALLVMFLMPVVLSQAGAAEKTARTGITDVGNKLCPVMGGPVDGEHFVVYEGRRYGLCCPACEKMFLNDPEKYIAQAEAEQRAPAAPEGTVVPIIDPASAEMQRDMEQAEL